MYLKALKMQGFKSFPDKTVLEFGSGITGVVGPNGSGKSNIADAIRWVLGEQSTKTLRGSKMEDVIFSGTNERRQQGYAEVTLVLDNSDNALNHPEKEVSVTRKFFRSGESVYQVNSQTVRLKDVHELFMDTGLGRDGYSMVSQGKIEEMVSAKSDNRRDMLEEAAGISHFRYRRAEAIKRLTQSEENLVRLRDIVNELKSRVGPLEKQSQKAQRFLTYSAERKELEIGLWLSQMDKITVQIRELRGKLSAVQNQYDFAAGVLENLSLQIDTAAEHTRAINEQIDGLREQNTALEEQASAAEAAAAVFKTSISHNRETETRIENDASLLTAELESVKKEYAESIAAVQAVEEQTRALNTRLNALSEQLAGLKNKDDAYFLSYNALQEEAGGLSREISQAQIMIEASRSSAAEINERIQSIQTALTQKAEQLKRLKEKEQEDTARCETAQAALDELNTAYRALARELKTAAARCEALQKEYEEQKLIYMSKLSRLKFLEDTEKNMEGYQGSVKAVIKEREKGNLGGIRGTFIQLISVEERYGLAIETALGNAVQDIVTEDEESAKKAIRFLQKTNLGRATFLPLNAITGRVMEETELAALDGAIAPAWRLVSCEDEYAEIVKSLLGRIIVCTDLDKAVNIAKQQNYKYKIVTLDGQVINAGGSMTGGSKISHSGFLSRRNEAKALREECAQLNGAVERALTDKQNADEALQKQNELFRETGARVVAQNGEKTAREGTLTLTRRSITETQKSIDELKKELSEKESRLSYFTQSVAIGLEEQKGLEIKKARLEQKISELSGSHDTLTAKREQLNEEITAVNLQIVSLMKEKEAKNENAASLTRRVQSINERLKALSEEKTELLRKNGELLEQAQTAEKKAEGYRLTAKKNSETIEALIKERQELEGSSVNAREAEREKNRELENLSSELVRLEERRQTAQTQLTETEKKLYDEYSLTRREAAERYSLPESVSGSQKRLTELKGLIKALGSVNVSAIDEYKEVSERYTFLSAQVNDVEQAKKELLHMIDDLTHKMTEQFKERFQAINTCFQETFVRLFGGGNACLIPENENDILECAIDIKAQPPGKNVTGLSLLSGGEKGLTAIALLFAILKVRPAPFCVFDEVEAALDDINVSRYAQYVRAMTENSQFILITHRRGTMEEADVLYGVTMQEQGVSKLLELKTAELVEQMKLED